MRLITLLLFFQLSTLPGLEIGDQAPAVTDVTWLKNGPPPAEREWTVVEFWATWCPPCIDSIPELTRLHQSSDRVTILGLSDEPAETLTPFIEGMGDQMNYHVASAGASVLPQWTSGWKNVPLPLAFLIDPQGQMVWFGNTASLEPALNQALNGKLSIANNKQLCPLEMELSVAMNSRRLAAVDSITQKILAIDATHPDALFLAGAVAQQYDDPQRFRSLLDRIDPGLVDGDTALDIAAWLLSQEHFIFRNLDLALPFAKQAVQTRPGDPLAAATLARGYYLLGNLERAIELQTQALAAAGADQTAYQPALDYYQTAQRLTKETTGAAVSP